MTKKQEYEKEVLSIIAKVLKIKKSQLIKNQSLGSIKEWDSLAHLNIFFELKKRYIKIDLNSASTVRSVKDWINLINKKYND
jgi:acyl carrier protein